MKKLSLLMALAMLITVGGVYATWTYHEGVITQRPYMDISLSMAPVTSQNAKGTLDVNTNTLTITIDDKGGYLPQMLIGGYVEVIFIPNSGVSNEVQNGDLNLEFRLYATRAGQEINVEQDVLYNGVNVFTTYQQTPVTINTTNREQRDVNGVNAWVYKIEASEIARYMQINEEIHLPTYTEFDLYRTAVISGQSYTIEIGEIQPTA